MAARRLGVARGARGSTWFVARGSWPVGSTWLVARRGSAWLGRTCCDSKFWHGMDAGGTRKRHKKSRPFSQGRRLFGYQLQLF